MTSKFTEMFNPDVLSSTEVRKPTAKMTTIKISEDARDKFNRIKALDGHANATDVVDKLYDLWLESLDEEMRQLIKARFEVCK